MEDLISYPNRDSTPHDRARWILATMIDRCVREIVVAGDAELPELIEDILEAGESARYEFKRAAFYAAQAAKAAKAASRASTRRKKRGSPSTGPGEPTEQSH